MTATSEPRSTTIWPTLRYIDARSAIHFLVSTFGFVEKAVYGEGDVVDHAQLDWPGGGGIMLGSPRTDSAIAGLPPGIGSVYIVVDDAEAADALYERVVASGTTITQGLRDEDYGSRGFTCRDPEGVYWSFGTYAGE
ncbi:VOC family protein [Rhodococcus sp. IEGM 1409]|uniref:VOC family protein n=1 Tax=Rhodococcus sp. IEGM 1409 TaxID=3047082 RepID=UPI0024B6D0AA|nr:VOC family protein [Rhodococcus sp. IEGM 1409]MDI9898270.1 VOC family protein [Rhodococcus sp. IEGM 1409]